MKDPAQQPTATLAEEPEDDRPYAPGYSLVLFHGARPIAVPLLEGVAVVVGRADPADVVLDDPNLSRQHARITLMEAGRARVEDLGSTNGTRLGGRRVKDFTVGPGDDLRFGALAAALVPAPAASPDGEDLDTDTRTEMIGQSPALTELREMIARVASSDIPVLVHGETGTGKELVARALHATSPRADGPMRSVNCGALPETLLASTLFGHERGSFTGADRQSLGVFEQAAGGTVFLDEIGELSPSAQAALLRVLSTKRLTRVGGTDEVEVDARVVAATHRDLEAMTKEGAFREDLMYRLNAIVLRVPPLRDRPEDVEILARHFLAEAADTHRRPVQDMTPQAAATLAGYAWPGNVRELRNAIERAVVVASGPQIGLEDLPDRVRGVAPAGGGAEDPTLEIDFKEHIKRYEARLMREALRKADGNKTQAARLLRMPVRTFVHKFRAFGLKGEP